VPLPQDIYNELACYTLAHHNPAFIHQHIVDAFAIQQADETTKPIAVVFGLVGLYLHVEKSFTGRQVQLVHMRLAGKGKQWPQMLLPEKRGDITVTEVLAATAGPERDEMIHRWCGSIWEACEECKMPIAELLKSELHIM
jgi:hypothetical protein